MACHSALLKQAWLTCYQNKSLSDDIDALLALQGLSWFTRKAIGFATVVVRSTSGTGDAD